MLLRKSLTAFSFSYISGIRKENMTKHTIRYHSKSDGQIIEREFDPRAEDQREFVAKSTGNLCRVYFDVEKQGYRTATNDWIVSS